MTNFAQMFLIIGALCSPVVVSEGLGWAKKAILSSPMDTLLELTPVPALAVGLAKKALLGSKDKSIPTVDSSSKVEVNTSAPAKARQLKMQVKSQNNEATDQNSVNMSDAVMNSKLKTKTIYHLKVPTNEPVNKTKEDKSMEEFKSLLNTGGHVSVEDVSLKLITELKTSLQPGGDQSRISKWEVALRPLFSSLEKNSHGNLDQASARYVLHRAFARQHGWYMTGLEPRDASSGPDSLKEWVPSYLLNLVEELLGTKGINNQELAVLAATFEDLVRQEAVGRLKEIYEHMHLPLDGYITDQSAEEVIQTYMAMYTSAQELDDRSAASHTGMALDLGEAAQVWVREVQRNVTSTHVAETGVHGTSDLDFKATARIIEHVGEEFSSFNNQECRALKSALLEVEDSKHPGHVRLYDFYKKGLQEDFWTFDESIEYLRVLGALDESESQPRVIVPNYVSSETNCLTASRYYKSCCRSECEELMGHLEREINAPTATPGRIAKIIAGLPADAVAGPGAVSPSLFSQLNAIAANDNGQVSLHGRSFAQWMHDAFPRECPVPHASKHPQTPDEWLAEYGADSATASREVRLEHVELHAFDAEQMPWNVDAIAQQQCPIPEPYVPESSKEIQPIRKNLMSFSQFGKNTAEEPQMPTKRLLGSSQSKAAMSEPEAAWHMFEVSDLPTKTLKVPLLGSSQSKAVASEPETSWHMFEVSNDSEQTPAVHAEKPWHIYEIPDQTPPSHAHLHDVSKHEGIAKAKTNILGLPRSAGPVPAKAPDADALFHQVYDTLSSEEDEVIPMGKVQLPKFDITSDNTSEPATSSVSWSEAFVRGLQKIEFLFLTLMLFAAASMEWMRKRNAGWRKRNEDGYRLGCGEIDMGLVRMAAAASVNQRHKPSASQDMV